MSAIRNGSETFISIHDPMPGSVAKPGAMASFAPFRPDERIRATMMSDTNPCLMVIPGSVASFAHLAPEGTVHSIVMASRNPREMKDAGVMASFAHFSAWRKELLIPPDPPNCEGRAAHGFVRHLSARRLASISTDATTHNGINIVVA